MSDVWYYKNKERARAYNQQKKDRKRDAMWHAWRCVSAITGMSAAQIGHSIKAGAPTATIGAHLTWLQARREAARVKERQRTNAYKNRDGVKERVRAYTKKYRQENPQRVKGYSRKWKVKVGAAYSRKYTREKRQRDPVFRMVHNLRNRLYAAVVMRGGRKGDRTMGLVGCTPIALRKHIEKQWREGMSWENYGEWHIDHIIPCAAFNMESHEDQRRCFHYSNLQPLWAMENLIKNDRITAPVQPTLALC